ncbi:hypothetical protein [Streptomyces sp. CA2R106]|uniref:hypothetical protein n=1 Tax=Streptomyces sp. CA2R106 TaxID=3120153 RepID=UPI0030097EF1
MTAAELRDRAIRHLTGAARPTPQDIAEADVWSRLALSAAISETGTVPVAGADPS